jgi:hypothetical protein
LKAGKLKEAITAWERSVKAWQVSAPADRDSVDIAKVQKKLEGAKTRLSKENSRGEKN